MNIANLRKVSAWNVNIEVNKVITKATAPAKQLGKIKSLVCCSGDGRETPANSPLGTFFGIAARWLPLKLGVHDLSYHFQSAFWLLHFYPVLPEICNWKCQRAFCFPQGCVPFSAGLRHNSESRLKRTQKYRVKTLLKLNEVLHPEGLCTERNSSSW